MLNQLLSLYRGLIILQLELLVASAIWIGFERLVRRIKQLRNASYTSIFIIDIMTVPVCFCSHIGVPVYSSGKIIAKWFNWVRIRIVTTKGEAYV